MKRYRRDYRDMEKVDSSCIYDKYIEAVGRRYKYSNCYFQKEELKEWLRDKLAACYDSGDSFVLTVQKKGFVKLYFLADTFDWTSELPEIKKHAGDFDLAVEIVKHGNLEDYDLRKYFPCRKLIQYDRLRSKGIETNVQEEEVTYCEKSDFIKLRAMMDETFHPIGDYIPSDQELDAFLSGRNVICVRDGEKIEGFIIYEDKGKTSYIRMVCVNRSARGKGQGERLMRMYFAVHQGYKGFTLWCRADNTPAMKLYAKLGQYRNEDLHNFVFVW